MDNKDPDSSEQNEGLRAGGDVQTKGASIYAPSGTEDGTRAGGDVQTKGASRDEDEDNSGQSE